MPVLLVLRRPSYLAEVCVLPVDFYREKLIIGSTIYMKIMLVSVSVFEQYT